MERQREDSGRSVDPSHPVYVISVAAELVRVHPRTLRIYEDEGLLCPARTSTNIRRYSENDIRRITWIRHLTQNLGVNLAGIRVLFELEERLGMRILEQLYSERHCVRPVDRGRTGCPDRRTRGVPRPGGPATIPLTRARHAPTSPRRTDGPRTTKPQAKATDAETPQAAEPGPFRTLPLVALRETVIFPEMIVPLQVGRDKSVQALNKAVADGTLIALVTQRQADREDITDPSELYEIGTLAKIAQVGAAPGRHRACHRPGPAAPSAASASRSSSRRIVARVEVLADDSPQGVEVQALVRSVQGQIEQYVQSGAPVPPGGGRRRTQHHRARPARGHGRVQPGHVHRAAPGDARDHRRHRAPEARSAAFLARQIEILELKGKIQSEVKSEMDKTQREYILREQLKAIQRELGEDDPQQAEINELREKVEASGMPEEVKARAIKEVDRMSRIPPPRPRSGSSGPMSTGSSALPWNVTSEDQLDIKEAARDPGRGPLRAGEGQGTHPRVPRGALARGHHPEPHPRARRDRQAWARPRSARASRRP